ncbi:hypothetical protein Daqu01_01720 [Deinococcus aquaticus]
MPFSDANVVNMDLSGVVPPASALSSGFFGDCQGTVSDTGTRVLLADELSAWSAQGDPLGTVLEIVTGDSAAAGNTSLVARLYADSPVTVKATCGTVKVDLTLQRGWNAAVFSGDSNALSLQAATPAMTSVLKFQGYEPQVDFVLNQPLDLLFAENETVTVPVKILQVGGYSGPVNLRTSDINVQVEPATITLPALPTLSTQQISSLHGVQKLTLVRPQMVEAQLTFRLNSGVLPYDQTTFQLEATSSSQQRLGGADGQLRIRGVRWDFEMGRYAFDVPQDGQGTVHIVAQPTQGFQGPVTFALMGLPAGVSFTPVTLDFTQPGVRAVDIPVQVAGQAALGVSQLRLKVTGPRYVMSGPPTLSINVKLPQYPLPSGVTGIFPAGSGFWGTAATRFVDGQYRTTVIRYGLRGEQLSSAELPVSYGLRWTALGGPRTLVADSMGNMQILSDEGAVTPLPLKLSSMDTVARTADTQGRVWMIRRQYVEAGVKSELGFIDGAGQFQLVDGSRRYGDRDGAFSVSPDGQNVLFVGDGSMIPPVLISAASLNVTTLTGTLTGQAQISNSGDVYFTSGYGLSKRDTTGAVTAVTSAGQGAVRIIGWDRAQPDLLWLTTDAPAAGSPAALKVSTGQIQTYQNDSWFNGTPALPSTGGLYILNQGVLYPVRR